MAWLRRNLMFFLVIGAIVLALVINNAHTNSVDAAQRADLVSSCTLANTGRALLSAYQRRTVANARTPAIAASYAAYSRGNANNLSIAQYIENPVRATRTQIFYVNGDATYVLTDESARLVAKGCALDFDK